MGKARAILVCMLIGSCAPALADMGAGASALPALASASQAFTPLAVAPSVLAESNAVDILADSDVWLTQWPLDPEAVRQTAVANLIEMPLSASRIPPVSDLASGENGDHENVVTLPPPPDGSTLTLSGLLTLAGLRVARSARHAGLAALLHVAYVPDWYYADAPQVGYSVPFDFAPTLQPACGIFSLIVPQPDPPAFAFYRPDSVYRIRSPQHTLLALIPRGPPDLT